MRKNCVEAVFSFGEQFLGESHEHSLTFKVYRCSAVRGLAELQRSIVRYGGNRARRTVIIYIQAIRTGIQFYEGFEPAVSFAILPWNL